MSTNVFMHLTINLIYIKMFALYVLFIKQIKVFILNNYDFMHIILNKQNEDLLLFKKQIYIIYIYCITIVT